MNVDQSIKVNESVKVGQSSSKCEARLGDENMKVDQSIRVNQSMNIVQGRSKCEGRSRYQIRSKSKYEGRPECMKMPSRLE